MIPSNSKVRINIEGLALCLYNQKLKRWEIAFPYDKTHQLKITITKIVNGIKTDENFPISVGEILHITNKGAETLPIKTPNFNTFIDLEDKVWMYPNGVKATITDKNCIRVSIKDACFYAATMTADEYRIVSTQGIPSTRFIGYMGDIAGAWIDFQSIGEMNWQIEGNSPVNYDINSSIEYEINFYNDCNCIKTTSDFGVYYNIVEPIDDPNRYILEPNWLIEFKESFSKESNLEERIASEATLRNERKVRAGRVDCDPAQLSQLDTFF